MNLKGKKVLVTGACGFIGSHLVERLLELEAEVKAFVYYNSFNHCGWLDSFSKEKLNMVEVAAGDIRDFHCVKSAMQGIQVVFHLAALIGIPYSYVAPESYVDTNIKGTLNVLSAARDVGVEKVIHTSTSEVYGTARYVPINEKHPFQGQSPYSATKIGADMLAESFYRSFDLPVAVCRPFNTYGPRQSARAVIPAIITQITGKKKNIQLGSLDTTRDFNYVADTVEGFIKIGESEKAIGEVINIGTGLDITIGDLARKIIKLCGFNLEIKSDAKRIRPLDSEVYRLCADSSKAEELVGWKPEIDLNNGLAKTINWLKQNKDQYNDNIYNV